MCYNKINNKGNMGDMRMMNIIDLTIGAIVIYLAFKYLTRFSFRYIKWLFTDKDRVFQEERMSFENTIYAQDFFRLEKSLVRKGFKTEGVYIFTNKRNGKKYVGQSVDLIRRLNEHMNGRGNQGVHEDMSFGDEFTIRLIKLSDTHFRDLDKLEKHYITRMNSYYSGYNKTRGNG